MDLKTSRYGNRNVHRSGLVPVRISHGTPKWPLGYAVDEAIPELMPPGYLMQEQDREVFRPKYRRHLYRVGAARIRERFEEISARHGGRGLVLLCFERVDEGRDWCHRQVFAEWWKDQTGETIVELPEARPASVQLKLFAA